MSAQRIWNPVRWTLLSALGTLGMSGGPVPPTIVTVTSTTLPVPPPPPAVVRVKYLCGTFYRPLQGEGTGVRVKLTGEHFTVVNVLNPHNVPSPARGPYAWNKEIIVDIEEPPPGVLGPSIRTEQIPFALNSMAAMEIDCPDIVQLLQAKPPGLQLNAARNSKGFVVIQAPCIPVGNPKVVSKSPVTYEQTFHCFQPVVQTVYEHLGDQYVNKITFRLSSTVGPALPGNKLLEIILPVGPGFTGVVGPGGGPILGFDIEENVRNTLSIPSSVAIEIVQVTVAARPVSLDVETASRLQ